MDPAIAPSTDPQGVSVVIPTRGGRADLLAQSLDRLLADAATAEVVIVLDRPDAATSAVVEAAARGNRRVRSTSLARAPTPPGNREQAARDTGVRLARHEIILALDDDVMPGPGLVSGHLKWHDRAEDLVVLGYMPVTAERGSRGSGSRAAARLYAESYERACQVFRSDPDGVLTGLWGGNFSLPRSRWLSAASRPSILGSGYHPDREFGLRLRANGMRGVFDSGLHADHHYVRSIADLLSNARSSGVNQARLHRAYPDVVEQPLSYVHGRGIRRGIQGQVIVWLAGRELLCNVIERALVSFTETVGARDFRRLEYLGVRLLWRLGFVRGARSPSSS